MNTRIIRLCHGFILLCCTIGVLDGYAQDETSASYYLDINSGNNNVIHDIQDQVVSLRYHDLYGQAATILLKVYDWKREEVAAYSLSKSYGVNYYNLNAHAFLTHGKEGDVYTLEISDEAQHRYSLLVRKTAPPEKEKPQVNIFVNPLHVACQDLGDSIVEFYGSISGGKPPYTIHWYVLNDQRTVFLYQPQEQVISRAGNTPVIRVDKDPDYHVLLHVRDACGMEQKQMVNLVCRGEGKKIHTLFMEPIQPLLQQPQKIK